MFPTDGGPARPLTGLKPGDWVIRFDASGESLFLYEPGLPLRIVRLELATGRRTLWKEIALPDPTGVTAISSVQLTADGACYCYSVMRTLSRLYVVEGLR